MATLTLVLANTGLYSQKRLVITLNPLAREFNSIQQNRGSTPSRSRQKCTGLTITRQLVASINLNQPAFRAWTIFEGNTRLRDSALSWFKGAPCRNQWRLRQADGYGRNIRTVMDAMEAYMLAREKPTKNCIRLVQWWIKLFQICCRSQYTAHTIRIKLSKTWNCQQGVWPLQRRLSGVL